MPLKCLKAIIQEKSQWIDGTSALQKCVQNVAGVNKKHLCKILHIYYKFCSVHKMQIAILLAWWFLPG